MKFSDKVYYLRKKKGLTQVELAEKANVSQGMIWLFEAGRRKPAEYIEKLIEYKLKNEGLI